MARELKSGEFLRALGAIVTVKTAADVGSPPVVNLKVMQADRFFVDDRGMPVHDNSLV
jgi:hypothetical protein